MASCHHDSHFLDHALHRHFRDCDLMKEGTVYCVYDAIASACKIGHTITKGARQRSVVGSHQHQAIYLCGATVTDVRRYERICHEHFAAGRVHGEWFAVDPLDVLSFFVWRLPWFALDMADLRSAILYIAGVKLNNADMLKDARKGTGRVILRRRQMSLPWPDGLDLIPLPASAGAPTPGLSHARAVSDACLPWDS